MRHESLFFLYSAITRIKGVGSSTAQALQRLLPVSTAIEGSTLPTVRDLLFHLPVGIVDRRHSFPLSQLPAEPIVATFVVQVDEHIPPPPGRRAAKRPYKVICSNDTGSITLVFFHAREDYIKQALPLGSKRVISGRVEPFDWQLQMPHPDIIAPVDRLAEVQKQEPVYPLTIGLTSRRIARIVADAMAKLPDLPEWIAAEWITAQRWPSWKAALALAHHPQSEEDLSPDAPPRLRLAYDEMLANQLYLARLRRSMQQQAGAVITGTGKLTGALLKSLPFTLTKGQEKVLVEIAGDMASGRRMGRLLQGDVGSGKTVVAVLAMLRSVEQGLQAALMVPTEIIAQQHYETLSKMLANIPSPLEGEGREGGYAYGYEDANIDRAKELRNTPTDVEQKLWQYLRRSQINDFKFRRQQPIGNYIVDFFCPEAKLIVELDGGQHADQAEYDARRTKLLEAQGYRVLRFWNNEVSENSDGVYQTIVSALNNAPPPAPSLKGRGVKVVLLTGSVKGKARDKALAAIASAEAQIIVGTHALFQEHVNFSNLAMVVIDEQHRFGVAQRMALTAKGDTPHVLHMTATPIPRSLTMTLYGDMDCSMLREKPAARLPITTRVIPLRRYGDIMERLKAALERGDKAYWICPLIEAGNRGIGESGSQGSYLYTRSPDHPITGSPDEDIAAAETRFTEFKARFGERVGLVHGRMKADDRNAAMQKFASGDTRLLVATTVVEVGVDVRNATIMVVEKAERFGLSQLHQLRGRVGRADLPSFCVLLYSPSPLEGEGQGGGQFTPPPNPLPQGEEESAALQRLSILRETEDGFRIAEADLDLRGGGDLLGTRQSGLPRFIFTDLIDHRALLEHARDDAAQYLNADPALAQPRGQALRILLQLFGFEDAR